MQRSQYRPTQNNWTQQRERSSTSPNKISSGALSPNKRKKWDDEMEQQQQPMSNRRYDREKYNRAYEDKSRERDDYLDQNFSF